jgi:hypothetical protein
MQLAGPGIVTSCRKLTARPERREISVYDGALYRGRIVIEDKAFASYDAEDHPLGVFKCQGDAMRAFNAGRA